jgi:hypothetical protein
MSSVDADCGARPARLTDAGTKAAADPSASVRMSLNILRGGGE